MVMIDKKIRVWKERKEELSRRRKMSSRRKNITQKDMQRMRNVRRKTRIRIFRALCSLGGSK
jgi:hypothetical protein